MQLTKERGASFFVFFVGDTRPINTRSLGPRELTDDLQIGTQVLPKFPISRRAPILLGSGRGMFQFALGQQFCHAFGYDHRMPTRAGHSHLVQELGRVHRFGVEARFSLQKERSVALLIECNQLDSLLCTPCGRH
jgi:hypothetical protein